MSNTNPILIGLTMIILIVIASVGGYQFKEHTGSQPESGQSATNGVTISSGSDSQITVYLNADPAQSSPVVKQGSTDQEEAGELSDEPEKLAATIAGPPPDPYDLDEAIASATEAIKRHEGYSEVPYILHGEIHICYGHYVTGAIPKSLTSEDCEALLLSDTEWSVAVAQDFVGGATVSNEQMGVVIELAYILGRHKLNEFVNLRGAIAVSDWEAAAMELQDSLLPDDDQLGQSRVDNMKERLLK